MSLLVSLWAGRWMEAQRARRDNISKLFEAARDDIRRAVEAAVDYFSTEPAARTPLQEARVLLADREVRSAIPHVLDTLIDSTCSGAVAAARTAYESLVIELTGGNFQEKTGGVSSEHIRRLAHAGAGARTALAILRDAQLKASVESDPALRLAKRANSASRRRLSGTFKAKPTAAEPE